MNKYNIVFDSERINFINISYDLINDYLNMVNDKEVSKFISKKDRIFTFEQEKQWIYEKLEEKALVFSMLEKDTNKFIGNIEIMNINNNIGELGISITREMQDKHYGTESIKRIIEYGFNELKLEGFALDVFTTNKRAIHCYEKLGFISTEKDKTEEDIHMILKK